MSWQDRIKQLQQQVGKTPTATPPPPVSERGRPVPSRANLIPNQQVGSMAQRIAGAKSEYRPPAPGGPTMRPAVMPGSQTVSGNATPAPPRQWQSAGALPPVGGAEQPTMRPAVMPGGQSWSGRVSLGMPRSTPMDWRPSWMGPSRGSPTQLRDMENQQRLLPYLGTAAGAATGIPGLGLAARGLNRYQTNQMFNNHYFQSPAATPNQMSPAMHQVMSRIDPNYSAMQQSSQGFAAGRQQSGPVGANFGFRGMRGGRGSALGGGWQTVYQRPDEEEPAPAQTSS